MTQEDIRLCRTAILAIEKSLQEMKIIIFGEEEDELSNEPIHRFLNRNHASRRLMNVMHIICLDEENLTVKGFVRNFTKEEFRLLRNCGQRTADEMQHLLQTEGINWF